MQADEKWRRQRRVGPLDKLMRVRREQPRRLADTGNRAPHRSKFTLHHIAIALNRLAPFSTVHNYERMIVGDRHKGHLQDLFGTHLAHASEDDVAYIHTLQRPMRVEDHTHRVSWPPVVASLQLAED